MDGMHGNLQLAVLASVSPDVVASDERQLAPAAAAVPGGLHGDSGCRHPILGHRDSPRDRVFSHQP